MKYVITLNGMDYEVEVDELDTAIVSNVAPAAAPVAAVAAPVVATPSAPAAPAAVSTGGSDVIAPMPGTILSVNITSGQDVKAGDVLFILEAMKMENEIVAPCDGKISSVLTTKGSSVATDTVLAVIGGTAVAPAAVPAGAPVAAPVAAAPAPVVPTAPVAVGGSGTAVKAPMPGTILNVSVVAGQAVKEGDVLFILEAMKMENEIVAPVSGTISSVTATKGSSVATDDALAFIG